MVSVNVASLKAELSYYLSLAKSGEKVIVTSHGKEVAELQSREGFVFKDSVCWAGFLKKHEPIKPLKQDVGAGELIRQIRDEEWL